MRKVIELYKGLTSGTVLMPTNTSFLWWEGAYTANAAALDREFVRRFRSFLYYDFLEDKDTTLADSISDFKADVLSILTLNQKKYDELYRIYTISDDDLPITYNYDMTEVVGAQHSETSYGAHEIEYGGTSETKGSQENTYGATSDTHSVAPFNSTEFASESKDESAQYTITDGSRTDTSLAHTDTDKSHKDEYDEDEHTLTRKGNIGVQTGADIARIFENFWINNKFMLLIFEDICKQLLMIGDC